MSPNSLNLISAFSIALGALECFLGYRLFKFALGVIGFFVGALLAGEACTAAAFSELVVLIAGVAGGIIGAVLAIALYFVGVFLFGAFLGGVLGAAICGLSGFAVNPLLLLIPSVVAGVLAVFLQKYMIIASTAFGGSWYVVMGAAHFVLGTVDPFHFSWLLTPTTPAHGVLALVWLLLGAAGLYVQCISAPPATTKKPRDVNDRA